MGSSGFEAYSGLKVEDIGITPIDIDDIDTSSLKEQEKIRYSQDTNFVSTLLDGLCLSYLYGFIWYFNYYVNVLMDNGI